MRSGLRTKAHWNDYIAHTRRQIWGGVWLSWRVWLVTILPYIIGAGAGLYIVPLLSENGIESGNSDLVMAGLLGAVGAYVANRIVAPFLQKPLVADEGVFCGSLTLSWNENDVSTSTGGATHTVSWSALSGMTETKQTLFLAMGPCEALVIPLSVFEDEKDVSAFKTYAEARIELI